MKSLAGWAFAVFMAGVMFGQWIGDTHARYTAAKSGGVYYGRVSYECSRRRRAALPDMTIQNGQQKSVEASRGN